jgi:hypothetical protein
LKAGDERYHFAFERNCFAIDEINPENRRGNLMAAYDYNNTSELEHVKSSIMAGLNQFEQVFGFKSKTTIAPCYVWDEIVENVFHESEVHALQGSYIQNSPIPGKAFQKKHRYTGQKNAAGQQYFIRNGLFEPSIATNVDWVDKCLESINIAFKWGKPAIIGTHRINFCSRLNADQTKQNLADVGKLISEMLMRWPEIQFKDSTQLINSFK